MDHLTLIHTETNRFIATLSDVDPGSAVRTCPDWTAADLLWHLTEVHSFWARVLSTGALTDEESEALEQSAPARPGDAADTVALLQATTDALVAELAARDDAQPAWTWFGSDQTVGFIRRMQLHEATMHRIDAESTAGSGSEPIDADVAADAIEHAVDVMWAWWGTLPGFTFTPAGEVVALTATDLDRTWLLQGGRWRGVGESGTSYDQPGVVFVAEGEPAGTWSGTADHLARWLWGRGAEPPADGDDAVLAPLREVQAQGMQ